MYGGKDNSHIDGFRGWPTLFPSHWTFQKGKRIFSEISKKNNNGKELLAVTQDRGVILKKLCSQNYVSPAGSLAGLKLVQQNDFVISLRSFQGGIEFSEHEGIVSPAYTVMALKDDYSDERFLIFYRVLFKSKNFIKLLNTVISGIRDGKNISFSDFSELEIPVPPIEELDDILKAFRDYEKVRKITEREIELIQEYRTRLVSDVVTGEVDVRSVEIPDFEPVEADLEAQDDEEPEDELITEGMEE
ncbi:MAG: restriction endonuclease subunit S [Candidatus Thiodiazotropha endolucinida]